MSLKIGHFSLASRFDQICVKCSSKEEREREREREGESERERERERERIKTLSLLSFTS